MVTAIFVFNFDNALWSLERFLTNSISVGTDDNGTEFSATKEITYASKCLWCIRLTTGLLLFRKSGHFEDMGTFLVILYGKLNSFDFAEHFLNSDDKAGSLQERGKQVVWQWSFLLRRWWDDFLAWAKISFLPELL